jgi:hypothetical protein
VQGKIPWFNATPVEAEQACAARGGHLCSTTEWQRACTINPLPTDVCFWGYAPNGGPCRAGAIAGDAGTKFCNLGPTYDFDPVAPGDQDGLLMTGAPTLQKCYADWTGQYGNVAPNDKIFDVTGNLREITKSATNVYPLLGGAFGTQNESGATCQFTFYRVDGTFQLYDLGFRCCFSADPTQ